MKALIVLVMISLICYMWYRQYKNEKNNEEAQAGLVNKERIRLINELKEGKIKISELKDESAAIVHNWAGEVVKKYGQILSENPNVISDIELLPFTKDEIAIALMLKIYSAYENGRNELAERFEIGFIQLSTFQKIESGDMEHIRKVEEAKTTAENYVPDSEEITDDYSDDMKKLVEGYRESHPVFIKYMDKVDNESVKLSKQIESFIDKARAGKQ